MRLMFLGDIVGRTGREAVIACVPKLRADLALDLVVANAENAAHGFGLSPQIAEQLFACGIDALTTGNHVWDKKELIPVLERDARILRPLNYPEHTPGRGAAIVETRRGRALVANVMGRLFMDPLDDPFAAIDRVLKVNRMGQGIAAVLVDVHGEATSEKMALAHHLDGRASLVVGTHTHVPTADAQLLPGGTAYQSDAGMCGDYDSVIGMVKGPAVQKLVRKMPGEKLSPAEGPATVCGVVVETEPRTGLALSVQPIRLGGRLAPATPKLEPAREAAL